MSVGSLDSSNLDTGSTTSSAADSSSTASGNSASGDFSLLSGSINFTGLGSGTDFTKVVDQLCQIESINKNRMMTWRSTWQSKITSMQGLNSRLSAMESTAGNMNTAQNFLARTVNSSNGSVVSATCDNTAKTGAYQVTVGSNVPNILSSAGVADSNSTVMTSAGTLQLVSNGATYNVVLAGTETLSQLATAINTVTGSNIVATVSNDGTTSNPYRLVLTSGTGGNAGAITVTQDPTNFAFSSQNMALSSSSLGVSASLAGQYTGDHANGNVCTYAVTVQNVAGGGVVGTNSFDLSYTTSWDGGAASAPTVVTVPANYKPGNAITLDNGVTLELGSGTVANGQTLNVKAYANNVDNAEMGTWNGTSTVATQGNYQGSTNLTYSFTVVTGGTLQAGGGAGTPVLRWTNSAGATGTVSLSDSSLSYDVDQGLRLKLSAGTLVSGDTFQVQAFSPQQQQGQDKGLAQATKVVHSGFSDDAVTPVTTAASSFTYTYGGKTETVTVASGNTLSQLVTLINNDSNNLGVTASIINDGQGLPTSYKLVLAGNNSGAQYQITNVSDNFTGSSWGNGGTLGGGFSASQLATNSMTQVDGFPSTGDTYLQRSTNQVTGVVTGVTLNLGDAGTSVVTVSTDTSAIMTNIQAFVTSVNTVQSYIQQQTLYDATDTSQNGILIGNYAYDMIKSDMDDQLNNPIAGLKDGTDTYVTLAQIGIQTDPNNSGQWIVDSSTLQTALNNDPEAVANLFIQNTAKNSTGVAQRMYTYTQGATDPKTGPLNVLISNYTQIIADINTRIDSETTRIANYRTQQLAIFSKLETTLSQLNNESKSLTSMIAKLGSSSSSSSSG